MSAVPAVTTTAAAVSAQDLELEHAELLPARETLWVNPGGPIRYYPGPVHYYPGPVHYQPGPVHYQPGPVHADQR